MNAIARAMGSVRNRIVAANALTTMLLFAVLGLALHYAVQAVLISSIDRELEARTQGLAVSGRPRPHDLAPGDGQPPPPGDRFGGDEVRDHGPPGSGRGGDGPPDGGPPDGGPPGDGPRDGGPPNGGPGGWGGQRYRPRLFDASGRVTAPAGETEPWDAGALDASLHGQTGFVSIGRGPGAVRIISRPFPQRGPLRGVIQAPYPLRDVYRGVKAVDWILLALLPFALLGSALAGMRATGQALSPVADITAAARKLGARDLSQRLAVSGADEFAELSSTFNEMLGRLETAFSDQEELVQRLRATLEQQRRFTADASHELRTPLTAIQANTSLSLSTSPTSEEYREAMADIDGAAARMASLMNDLLLLARADDDRLGQETVPVLLRECAESAVARMKLRQSAAAQIDIQIHDRSLCVLANADQVTRLLINLLDNAARHTPQGGRITVGAVREGNWVRLQVIDTGAGIDPEHLPHLGERFYRADASRTRDAATEGGTGLGLSICKSIAEAHGGELSVHSALGVGTTVTVLLPAAEV